MSQNGTTEPAVPEMSRADRRIIFAQIEEVYVDETTGYRDGWSDSAVAKHLGAHIPLAWVAAVREENFGPVKDNGEVRDMLARVEQISIEARDFVGASKQLRTEGSALVTKVNDLCAKATDIAKRLDGLQATADRIKQYLR